MAEIQENLEAGSSAQPFRIDQKLHQILYKSEAAPKLEPMPQEVLPEPVYRLSVGTFGQDGTNELIFLVGLYCMVSMTLNGFNVPVPERD